MTAKKQLDYAVVEVGMGGRLDATNVITNPDKVCVITDIGLDHTQFLGTDVVSIAQEKAGIIQKGNIVFVANQDQAVLDVFIKKAAEQGATLHVLPTEHINRAPAHLPPFQKRNWALAKYAFDYVAERDHLRVSEADIKQSAAIQVPARMEVFNVGNKTIITDGSHNGQKITALCEGLAAKYPHQKFAVLLSFAEGKDTTLTQSLQALKKVADTVIVTTFEGQQDVKRRSMDPQRIAAAAKKIGFSQVEVIPDARQAFTVLQQQPEKSLLVTGSFFLLNHVRPLIK